MFAEYIKDRFPRRGCGHILGLFKQLIQDYVCTPEMPKICANSTELKNVNKS